MKALALQSLALALSAILSATAARAADSLVVKGSTTIGPVMREIGGKFASENKISVTVQGGGSGEGIKCAKAKACALGMASKAVEGADAEGLTVTHFGWDGLAFVVNAANTATGLTKDQITAIYTGKVKNWKEVGGKDEAIVRLTRSKDAGESDFFKHVFKDEAKGEEEVGPNDAVVVKVSKATGAIAFMSFGIAKKNLARGLKLLAVDGKEMSDATMKDGTYALRRELVLLKPKDGADANADKLIAYALDKRASFFENYGFIAE